MKLNTKKQSRLVSLILLAVSLCSFTLWAKPNTAPTPPMGWNSWNYWGKQNINEQIVRETIDAMAEKGLREAGYEYIIVDGGWRDVKLGPNGELLVHPVKFPSGMKALADYAHSKGFKFGLHIVPGTADCGGDPIGGYGHEAVHVAQFVEWGLDFVKIDKCVFKPGWDEPVLEEVYQRWSELLEDCGRDIVLSISAYRFRDWNPECGNMSRTTQDIGAKANGGAFFEGMSKNGKNHYSVMDIAMLNDQVADFAGPGYWNDPDMLVTGDQGLTDAEQRSHFALWCLMSSPLILGNDPRTIGDAELELVTNPVAIAINQDPTEQGKKLVDRGVYQIWAKKLSDGNVAVLLLNRNPYNAKEFNFKGNVVGLKDGWTATDVFTGETLPANENSLSVEVAPGSSVFFVTK